MADQTIGIRNRHGVVVLTYTVVPRPYELGSGYETSVDPAQNVAAIVGLGDNECVVICVCRV